MRITPSLNTFPAFRAIPGSLLRVLTLGRWGRPAVVDELLRREPLPAPLSEIVREVCARSRLWASEQGDVARELIAHFRDGIDAGVSADALAKDFGDPRAAAALIRRAQCRKRSVLWQFMHRVRLVALWSLAGLVALYVVSAIRFYTGSPTIATDYVAKLNEPLNSVPEDQRAWPLYKQALLALPPWPSVKAASGTRDVPGTWPDVRPGEPEYDACVAYIREAAPALELIRRGAMLREVGRPNGFDVDEELWRNDFRRRGVARQEPPPPTQNGNSGLEGSLVGVLLPHLGDMRAFARDLVFDTSLAVREKDAPRALANVRAMLGMSRQLLREPFLISQLVAYAISALAGNSIRDVLRDAPDLWTDEHLRVLAHELAISPAPGRAVPDLTGERWFVEDTMQRIFTDDGKGDGRLTREGVRVLDELGALANVGIDGAATTIDMKPFTVALSPIAMHLAASRKQTSDEYTRLMDLTRTHGSLPPWERISASQSSESPQGQIDRMLDDRVWRTRYLLLTVILPALDHAYWSADAALQQRDATLVVIAMHLFHRREGRWPASLDELTPRFIPSIPLDIYTGTPLRYTPAQGSAGPTLYSVGQDLTDEGGTTPPNNMYWGSWPRRSNSGTAKADWVFWPWPLEARKPRE